MPYRLQRSIPGVQKAICQICWLFFFAIRHLQELVSTSSEMEPIYILRQSLPGMPCLCKCWAVNMGVQLDLTAEGELLLGQIRLQLDVAFSVA